MHGKIRDFCKLGVRVPAGAYLAGAHKNKIARCSKLRFRARSQNFLAFPYKIGRLWKSSLSSPLSENHTLVYHSNWLNILRSNEKMPQYIRNIWLSQNRVIEWRSPLSDFYLVSIQWYSNIFVWIFLLSFWVSKLIKTLKSRIFKEIRYARSRIYHWKFVLTWKFT